MRDPEHLIPVLFALLQAPNRPVLLGNPTLLATYLRTDWPETDPEANGPWGTGEVAPGTQESQELAEIPCLVEQQLANLPPEELASLRKAVQAVCPDAVEMLDTMTPARSYAPA
jgi:hypothetical protein